MNVDLQELRGGIYVLPVFLCYRDVFFASCLAICEKLIQGFCLEMQEIPYTQ